MTFINLTVRDAYKPELENILVNTQYITFIEKSIHRGSCVNIIKSSKESQDWLSVEETPEEIKELINGA